MRTRSICLSLAARSRAHAVTTKAPAASPDAQSVDAANIVGTAIPLTSPDGSFYTAMVNIGSQVFALDVDTGSTTIGVAGRPARRARASRRSTRPAPVRWTATARPTTQYGDGSMWAGEVFTDMVRSERSHLRSASAS